MTAWQRLQDEAFALAGHFGVNEHKGECGIDAVLLIGNVLECADDGQGLLGVVDR